MTRRALGTGPTTTAAAGAAGERLLPVERLAAVPDDQEAAADRQQLAQDAPRRGRRVLGPRGARPE